MFPCLNGETAARDLTLTSTGGGSSSDMQRSPLYLVGCGWVGEDFKAPRSGAFLKHLGVHGVFCDAPEKTNAKTRAASIPRGLGTECMLRQNAKMHIPSRARASGCIFERRAFKLESGVQSTTSLPCTCPVPSHHSKQSEKCLSLLAEPICSPAGSVTAPSSTPSTCRSACTKPRAEGSPRSTS